MRIIATAAMFAERLRLKREGRLGSGMDLPARTPEERVRASRASLAIAGAPLMYRPTPSPAAAFEPTPEFRARAGHSLVKRTEKAGGEECKTTIAVVKGYRIKSPVEAHADKLSMDKRSALERFLQDSSYANRIGIVDLNRSGGGGSPGSRLGGLGNYPQHVRDGHARDAWIWRHLSPDMQKTARALVFRELLKPDGTLFSLEDFGAVMFPDVRDKNRKWGAAAGALWALGGELSFLYRNCPILVRRIDETERALEAAE